MCTGLLTVPNTGMGLGRPAVDGIFQSYDVGKKNVLLFHHVRGQLSGHPLECLLDFAQLWMSVVPWTDTTFCKSC